jgi:hypothetical protein
LVVAFAFGVQRWEKLYGGQSDDLGHDVHQTQDGGYIVAASTRSFNPGDKTAMWLLKLDSLGDTAWTRMFKPDDPGSSTALGVCQSRDGGYAAAGVWRSSVGAPLDTICFYVMKVSEEGDSLWSSRFGLEYDCGADDIQQTSDGGYILVGRWQSWEDPTLRGFAVKCDSVGRLQWSHVYGDDSTNRLYAAHQLADGGYIMAGCAHVRPYDEGKAWMLRTDSAGNVKWMKTYGGRWDQGLYGCVAASDGGFIGAGASSELSIYGDCWIVKVDSSGDTVFTRYLYRGSASDCLKKVCPTLDGGYMFSGETQSIGAGMSDALLIKTDAECNVQWLTTVGSARDDHLESAEQTADSGYIIVGITFLSGGADNDVRIWKTDEAGLLSIQEQKVGRRRDESLELTAGRFGRASSAVSIRYFLTGAGYAELAAYDVTGRRSKTLAADGQGAGWHSTVWDCRVPAGAYVLRLTQGSQSAAVSVTVLP